MAAMSFMVTMAMTPSMLVYDYSGDSVYAGNGDDYVFGSYGADYLDGGYGNDTIYAYDGNDSVYGGAENDTLVGDWGDDYLNGYGGNTYEYDTLDGGYGADTFVLGTWSGSSYLSSGYATINDFARSQGDKIQVNGTGSYTLDKSWNWSGTSALDTAIYRNGDLIAVVQDTTKVSVALDLTFA